MLLFGGASKEVLQRLADHEKRITTLEGKAETTIAIRQSRNDRRDFWVVKMIPSISALVVALLAMNAIFHWF